MNHNQLALDHLHQNPLGQWHLIDNVCENDPLLQYLTGNTSLHIFCKLGAYGDVRRLLTEGVDINSRDPNGDTPLLTALLTGNMTVVRELLNYQSETNILDVNCQNNVQSTPLHIASARGDMELVQALITRNANINAQNEYGATPLHFASLNGRLEIVKQLLNSGADIYIKNSKGETAIEIAQDNVKEFLMEQIVPIKEPVCE